MPQGPSFVCTCLVRRRTLPQPGVCYTLRKTRRGVDAVVIRTWGTQTFTRRRRQDHDMTSVTSSIWSGPNVGIRTRLPSTGRRVNPPTLCPALNKARKHLCLTARSRLLTDPLTSRRLVNRPRRRVTQRKLSVRRSGEIREHR